MWSTIKAFAWTESSENLNDETGKEENLQSLLLKEEDIEEKFECIQREGKITKLHEEYGLIDGEIYFLRSLKPKVSQGPLREGDCVKYRARRKDENQQWKVIEILWASKDDENWMEKANSMKKPNMYPGDSVKIKNYKEDGDKIGVNGDGPRKSTREVGKVIGITKDAAQVSIQTQDREERLSFPLNKFSFPFAICTGDFLCLEVELDGATLDDLSNLCIIKVFPLRTRNENNALITSWWSTQRKGIINNNIYFNPVFCAASYNPRANDIVEVSAIECEPGEGNRKCNWRAYKVSPSKRRYQKHYDIQSLIHNPTKENVIQNLIRNKNGIMIDDDIHFHNDNPAEDKIVSVQISLDKNRRKDTRQLLNSIKFQYPDPKNIPIKLCDESRATFPIELKDQPFIMTDLLCSSKMSYGKTKILCIFEFLELQNKHSAETKFCIGANLHLTVSDSTHNHILNANVTNGFHSKIATNGNSILNDGYSDNQEYKSSVIKGPRDRNKNGFKAVKATFLGVGPGAVAPKRLGEYALPAKMSTDAVYSDFDDLMNTYPLLDEELSKHNYPEKWHCLLHIEEASLLYRMRQYEMHGIVLRDAGQRFLSLDVPGLAEKRPSLMLGDTAIVRPQVRLLGNYNGVPNQKYEGVIEEVRSQSVLMAFDESFRRSYAGELVDVAFVLSRTNLKRMHVAAEHCFKQLGEKILFPEEVHLLPPQVDFVTNESNQDRLLCGSENTLKLKNGPLKLNIMKRNAFRESSYSTSVPATANRENTNQSFKENVSDISNSSALSGSFEAEFNSKSDNSICLSSKTRISVAERLFKQATEVKGNKNFITPKVPLAPYSWISSHDKNANPVASANPAGLKYEFILENTSEETTKNSSNNIKNEEHSASYLKDKIKQNILPAYIPRHMINNKGFVKGRPTINWVNQNLNQEQKSAVVRILAGEARPLPYIIYGPPGTGKTVTVVEAILQIFILRFDSRILVTTPSNSSADLIVERLHNSGNLSFGDLARLNAMQRVEESIPEIVRPYCFSNSDPEVLLKVVRHRIVVATCNTSGGIYKLGLTQGHFTHCVIDEAGETTEPQSMVPIGLLGMGQENAAQIILAGDPKQLGPVLQSKIAVECGLEESFLERLSKLKIYERDESRFGDHGNYDPVLCTKLIRNYRSHQDILHVSSSLFYDNELKPEAPEVIKNALLGHEFLPNEKCPLIFHGVRGQNCQENDSPSWFNPAEGLQVAKYLGLILTKGVPIEDIGIIAPYRKQTQKLRQLLDSFNLPKPKVRIIDI
jgi:putative helicase MOV10L1